MRFKGIPGGLRLKLHRPLPGDVGTRGRGSDQLRAIVLTREGRRWIVSLQCEIDLSRRCQSQTAAVGIDVGVSSLIAQSDGVLIPSPKPGKRASKAMRAAQRALSRAKRGSKRRAKTRERLARLHRTIANTRSTKLHTQAARLTRCYAMIAAEGLQIRNMTRSAAGTLDNPGSYVAAKSGLNRSINDAAWGKLRTLVAYKAARDGSRLVTVNPRYTSQTCPSCGAIKPKSLAERVHRCECGLVLDRDVAAAKVILSVALKGATDSGLPVRAGAKRSPRNTADISLLDGGGNTASIPARPREPKASKRQRGDPRSKDNKQLRLLLQRSGAEAGQPTIGPRNQGGST